ncbi:MAG TPA: pantoate--beta-alanine ligase [Dehalococcoidia bacterium]|jgi:pantoate--beta-alanine ligase|nr:pantoate--beta-alanine ligase [Dehalococcoidia bacterium]HCH09204.1 pantoate--beta-alanine ligase [Dehalococcoidia bacterium]HHZ62887.1 pantoate--beta-alanine ligase [Dehalococcoidia bacterium]HIM18371.1 pantoate--beta-alanine ligase [Dehalococcoidia bacterium]
MQVIETVSEFRVAERSAARPLGLVPTMGYLHEGHMSLARRARADNATVSASIFVNPTQFAPNEDLAAYPRDMDGDLAKLEEAGVDLVFAPAPQEVYPAGFDTRVDVGEIAAKLEGASRPDHFRGVATVVCKLLTIVRPDKVYFGQKDAQQCLVIKRLNADLNLGAEVVVIPTIRDSDGLALSSRNAYLRDGDRESALTLSRSLNLAREMHQSEILNAKKISAQMRNLIESEPRTSVDYISISDAETLDELDIIDRPALVSLAVRIGDVRLIDNTLLP